MPPRRKRSPWRWAKRLGIALPVALCCVVLLAAGWIYAQMGRSLPLLDGNLAAAGAPGRIEIQRDAAGMPTIRAADRGAGAYGLGFLHAQERFFQMDISRHLGAGELAELFGAPILPIDRRFRLHRLRAVAQAALSRLPAAQSALLDNYVAGVNAGLAALAAPPFEYSLLNTRPRAWDRTDTMLTILSMYFLLQDSEGDQDYNTDALYRALPPKLAAFLAPAGSADWDSPLAGAPTADAAPPSLSPGVLHAQRSLRDDAALTWRFRGSNGWAVAGRLRAGQGGLVANDMHLLFGMPNTFYKMRCLAGGLLLVGLTLPGVPGLVAGSNGHVAWSLTNSAGEWSDLIRLVPGQSPGTYRTADGDKTTTRTPEILHVKGGADQILQVESTIWGPVLRSRPDGTAFAEQWVAHDPHAANLGLLELEDAASVRDALAAAAHTGMPEQNMMVADSDGHIAWTILGAMPRRGARDGVLPLASDVAGIGWRGWLEAAEYPRVVDPAQGFLWTANARAIDGADLTKIGHGYYILGARARQLHDDLAALRHFEPHDMLDIQRDDRAMFLSRWQALLLGVIDQAHDTQLAGLRPVVANWGGRADAASAGYRLVRAFRLATDRLVFAPFIEAVSRETPDFALDKVGNQREVPLWRLVSERPAGLLNPRFTDWNALLAAAAREAAASAPEGQEWGQANRLVMQHPMSPFIPLLGRLTDMAPAPLAGDENMPLSQQSRQGPVMRLVVAPGHEDQGVLELAGGEAGNPRSPYYGAGQADWLAVRSTPLLPGPAMHTLVLAPLAAASGHEPLKGA